MKNGKHTSKNLNTQDLPWTVATAHLCSKKIIPTGALIKINKNKEQVKMSNVLELRKNVVTYTQDKTEWKWKDFTLGQICKSPVYSSVKVNVGNKKVDLKTAVSYYQKLQDLKSWNNAKALKEIIWSALDEKSRDRIKSYYDIPEVRIASINRENTGNDAIVAFYALNEENYYNGTLENVVPGVYKEHINCTIIVERPDGQHIKKKIKDGTVQTVRFNKYKVSGTYREEHIIGGNGDVTFSDYMETSPNYRWLPKAIEIAKQFGVEPKWQPCTHSGKRGIGLTAHDAKELQAVANWYSGLSDIDQEDIKYDWSDKIWLHHENGIDSIQISEREYRQNPDKWADWKQTETRDFRCDLYEDEEELY
jgi:hypothetical protein